MLILGRTAWFLASLMVASCASEIPAPKLLPEELPAKEKSTSRPKEVGEWFFLKTGESHSQAASDGSTLGLTLLELQRHPDCTHACSFPGDITAVVDETVPMPIYTSVENMHFSLLGDGNLVDFAGAATTTEGGPWYGKFRLRTVSPIANALLNASYLLEAASPITIPAESLTIRLAAVEFESICGCDDPCGDHSCLCVLGTSVKYTAIVETPNGSGTLVLPGSFGGFTFSGTPRAGMCYSEIPYLAGFSLLVTKP